MKNQDRSRSTRNRLFRPRIPHFFYAMAILGASIAVWGWSGIIVGLAVIASWVFVYTEVSLSGRVARAVFCVSTGCLVAGWIGVQSTAPIWYRYMACSNRMRSVAIALHLYAAEHGRFPPAYIADEDGTPMHSWRVLILPYLEGNDIYDQYDFNQPWDSPANLALAKASSWDLVCCPTDAVNKPWPTTTTSFFAVTGPNTAWPDGEATRIQDLVGHGREASIILIEDHSRNVLWTEPVDVSYEEAVKLLTDRQRPAPHIHQRYSFPTQFHNVAFTDGTLRHIRAGISAEHAQALLSIDSGQHDIGNALRYADYQPRRSGLEVIGAGIVFLIVLVLPSIWLAPRGQRGSPG